MSEKAECMDRNKYKLVGENFKITSIMCPHTVAVCVRVCSSPVTLAFEPVVESNPLPRDTGPL